MIKLRLEHGALQREESLAHSLSVLKLLAVKAEGSSIILTGAKKYLLRASPTELSQFAESEPISISVELGPDTKEEDADTLPSLLFFNNLDAALRAIPERLKIFVPGRADLKLAALDKTKCDCSQAGTNSCQQSADLTGITRAKLLNQIDYKAPAGLSSRGYLGVISAITISSAGHISDIWIVRSSSADAASSVATALPRWKFAPAICHGAPVVDVMQVETDYRMQ